VARHEPGALVGALVADVDVAVGVRPVVDVARLMTQKIDAHAVAPLVERELGQLIANPAMPCGVGCMQPIGGVMWVPMMRPLSVEMTMAARG